LQLGIITASKGEATVITIPDPNLESIVRLTLGAYYHNPPYPPIEDFSMEALVSLYAPNLGITDLTGLEYATNITSLTLTGNGIASLEPISGLSKLQSLKIERNPVTDIRPIAGLTSLKLLWLGENPLSDFQTIADLTNLTNLGLVNLANLACIEFVSSLDTLTKITVKDCDKFSDLGPLRTLPNLKELSLERNNIRVLTPLKDNLDLGTNGATVWLSDNPLCQFSICRDLPELLSRGVLVYGVSECKGTIAFDDPYLEAAVGEAVGITGRSLYTDEVVGVGFTVLEYDGAALASLTGLEFCTDLVELSLSGNSITSLVPLHKLIRLSILRLDQNLITSVSSLNSLSELTYLNLDGNALSNTSELEQLPKLEELSASNNQFASLNRFSSLVHLKRLNLAENQIVISATYDGNALVNLTQLHDIDLRNNQITDLSALIGSQLADGDEVYLQGNPLGDTALTVQIPELEARGVIVHYDGQPPESPIVFEDPNLETAVRNAIQMPVGNIYESDVIGTGFISLNAASMQISALGGLEHCKDLTQLDLSNNLIQDITPLAALTSLRELNLNANSTQDLAPLSGLTQLNTLSLRTNGLTDISALGTLVNLTLLDAGDNELEDIYALTSLTKIEALGLDHNRINDLGPLTSLLNLNEVELSGNMLNEIVALVNNPGLSGPDDYVGLQDNPLSGYALCTSLPALQGHGVIVEYDGYCDQEGEGENDGGCGTGSIDDSGGGSSGNLLIIVIASVSLMAASPLIKTGRRQPST